jgi:hypothetical protein
MTEERTTPLRKRMIEDMRICGMGEKAARHGRVHPPVPDPRPARRLPPHPALRPARQRHPQGQHRENPGPARGGTAWPGAAGERRNGERRDHPAHPARAMPRLRRPHAHRRDLPPRPATAIAGATKGAGRMTIPPSPCPICLRISARCRPTAFVPERVCPPEMCPNRPHRAPNLPETRRSRQHLPLSSRTVPLSRTAAALTVGALSP